MMIQSKKPALLCIFLALFLATTTFADATASAEYLHGMVLLQSFDDGVVIGVDRGDVEIRDGIVDDIFVFQVEYGEVPDLYFLETAQVEYFHNSLNVYSLSDDRTGLKNTSVGQAHL